MVNIAVIGAGIAGFSSAVNVQRLIPSATVTIIADQFEEELVSYGAGGSFRPELSKLVKGDNADVMERCIRDSWDHYTKLATSEHAKDSGQSMVFTLASHQKPKDADYAVLRDLTWDFRLLSETEIRQRGIPKEFKYTYGFTTVISQVNIYLPWLKKQFIAKGGKIQKRTVNKLEELYGEYQLVINCCGDRARTFVGDEESFPTRGQLVRVKAPWFKHSHYFDTDNYMIPHSDKLNIGGIRIHGDGNRKIEPEVTVDILKRAEALYPRLKGAERIGEWAHSRPGRTRPRIEKEVLKLGGNRRLPVIHNYGHGGNGITLSWGCGKYVAELAKQTYLSMTPKAAL